MALTGRCRFVPALAACVVALGAPAASAQVYKWVDEKGVVNYGNKPPDKARSVTKMNEAESNVSTVPGMKPEDVQAQRDRALQNKVDQLEREVADARRSNAGAPVVNDAAALQRWREQCAAERRVDCDDPYRGQTTGSADYPYYYPPQIVRPPRPIPPSQSTVPPGMQIAPGPGGIGAEYRPIPQNSPGWIAPGESVPAGSLPPPRPTPR